MNKASCFEAQPKKPQVLPEQFRACPENNASLENVVQKRMRDAVQKETVQLRHMISDLERILKALDQNLEAELERSRVKDLSDSAFPMSARVLIKRRDNLKATIASLLERLERL